MAVANTGLAIPQWNSSLGFTPQQHHDMCQAFNNLISLRRSLVGLDFEETQARSMDAIEHFDVIDGILNEENQLKPGKRARLQRMRREFLQSWNSNITFAEQNQETEAIYSHIMQTIQQPASAFDVEDLFTGLDDDCQTDSEPEETMDSEASEEEMATPGTPQHKRMTGEVKLPADFHWPPPPSSSNLFAVPSDPNHQRGGPPRLDLFGAGSYRHDQTCTGQRHKNSRGQADLTSEEEDERTKRLTYKRGHVLSPISANRTQEGPRSPKRSKPNTPK